MAYSMVGADRRRPAVVTAAGYLLYVVAGLQAAGTVVGIVTAPGVLDTLDARYATDPDHDVVMTAAKLSLGISIGINVLLTAVLFVLAIFNLRGRNGMRVTTWVIGGLGALCLGCATVGSVTGSAYQQNATGSHAAKINVNDVLPRWAEATSLTLGIASLLGLAVAIILLAMPASNDFFRKPRMGLDMGYPGYPPLGVYPTSGVRPPDPP